MEDFIHLHVHTYYSILDGQSKIQNLVNKAIGDGMRGMAITDHGDMFGIKEFHDIVNEINATRCDKGEEPFKPIFGCEMYVSRYGSKLLRRGKEDQSGYHLIVLAKNYTGYKNLIKLVSRSWTDGFYQRPRTDREDLERYHEGLIVCSACIAGEVPKKILDGDMAGAREAVEWYHRVFGDDYYLELQRHEVTDPAVRANRETFPLQQQANKVLIELAREYGIKLICTNDVHFVDQDNAEAHDHLLCLSTGKDLDDPTRMLYSKQEWFKTKAEMNTIFSDVPEALSNTLDILDKVYDELQPCVIVVLKLIISVVFPNLIHIQFVYIHNTSLFPDTLHAFCPRFGLLLYVRDIEALTKIQPLPSRCHQRLLYDDCTTVKNYHSLFLFSLDSLTLIASKISSVAISRLWLCKVS